MKDKVQKNRQAKGEDLATKLTIKKVEEIRESSESQSTLAKRFTVSQSHISRIKTNQVWKQTK